MTDLKTAGRAWGNMIGWMLFSRAVQKSKFVSLDEDVKSCFVREFLVLCRFGLEVANGYTARADGVLAGIDEEFECFYPEWDDVFDARLIHYFEILKNRPPNSDLISCLVTDWAFRLETPPDVTSWALELLSGTGVFYRRLIGLKPVPVIKNWPAEWTAAARRSRDLEN